MNPSTIYLSKHLTLQAATICRPGFTNTPNEEQKKALIYWGLNVYDPICENFGFKAPIHSVFRDDAYNKVVGGAPGSQHRFGQAGDLDFDDIKGVDNKMLFDWAARNLNYDQIIWEYGTTENPGWVHISAVDGLNRHKLTRIYKKDDKLIKTEFDLYKIAV